MLLDMQLPDIDGLEVLRRCAPTPLTAASRCIALSANAMPTTSNAPCRRLRGLLDQAAGLRAFMASLDGPVRQAA
jgi:CheY-like chemotaxis protein